LRIAPSAMRKIDVPMPTFETSYVDSRLHPEGVQCKRFFTLPPCRANERPGRGSGVAYNRGASAAIV
jgi:hypothetical protein